MAGASPSSVQKTNLRQRETKAAKRAGASPSSAAQQHVAKKSAGRAEEPGQTPALSQSCTALQREGKAARSRGKPQRTQQRNMTSLSSVNQMNNRSIVPPPLPAALATVVRPPLSWCSAQLLMALPQASLRPHNGASRDAAITSKKLPRQAAEDAPQHERPLGARPDPLHLFVEFGAVVQRWVEHGKLRLEIQIRSVAIWGRQLRNDPHGLPCLGDESLVGAVLLDVAHEVGGSPGLCVRELQVRSTEHSARLRSAIWAAAVKGRAFHHGMPTCEAQQQVSGCARGDFFECRDDARAEQMWSAAMS